MKILTEKVYSDYSLSDKVGLGKRTIYLVLSFFLVLILHTAIFSATNLIAVNLPSFKSTSSLVSESYNQLDSMILESKLAEKEGGYYQSIDTLAKQYVYRLSLGSLHLHNFPEDQISKRVYANVTDISKANDNNYYYVITFRDANKDQYDNQISLQDYLSSYDSTTFLITNDYPYLSLEATTKLNEYLTNKSSGKDLYDNLFNKFSNALEANIKDLKKNNKAYVKIASSYEEKKNIIYWNYIHVSLISYSIAIFIYFLLFPLIFKNRENPALKLMRFTYIQKDSFAPNRLFPILSTPMYFLSYLCIPLLFLFIAYRSAVVEIITMGIIGPISLVHLAIFSASLLVLSYLLMFIPIKKKQRTLVEHCFSLDTVNRN